MFRVPGGKDTPERVGVTGMMSMSLRMSWTKRGGGRGLGVFWERVEEGGFTGCGTAHDD